MLDPQTIRQSIAFVERHGYALLFCWVLAEQGGIPLPSVPLLLIAGALVSAGRLQMVLAILCCVTAALLADTVWFHLGRQGGRRVLRFLCRVSLEPDSCVRQTENVFLKYGMSSLIVAKFIPGLNAVAAPLAGNSARSYWEFVGFDTLGTSMWSAAYLTLGYLFSEQLDTVMASAARMGSGLVLLVMALLTLWLGWKFLQRQRFLRQLDVSRITAQDLRDRLEAGEDLFIVDLRSRLSENRNSIPGARRISAEELTDGTEVLPRDRDIILVCD